MHDDPKPPEPMPRECSSCGSRRIHAVKVDFWPFLAGPTYWRCDDCFEIWTVRPSEPDEPT